MIRNLLITFSLFLFAVAAFAEVSGERPVSTIEYGPAPGQRYGTAAASDGRDFLVTWTDAMRNRSNVARLYAARMNAAGEILDPLGIRMPAPQGARGSVVFLGDAYLVYWDTVSPTAPALSALFGVRVSRDGIVLDAAPRLLADRLDRFGAVAPQTAASNGNRTVIVYGSAMLVLDRDANVVRGPEAIPTPGLAPVSPLVASNGRGFLIVWSRDGVREIPLDENGVAVSGIPTTVAIGTLLYGVASDGDSYIALLKDSASTLSAQHIGTAGEVLETSPVSLNLIFPGLVFSAGAYEIMDGDPVQGTVGVRRLDRTGKPLGSYVPLASAPAFGAGGTLASNGSDTAMFWTEWRSAQLFYGGVLSGQASALSKTSTIARSANSQAAPAAATSGRNHAVVWTELGGTYAGRLTLDGQLLDGRGIRVGEQSLTTPAIVFDGANYVIGWMEQSATPITDTVKVARLSADSGALLDAGGVTVASSPCANGLALAAGATSTLVSWSDCNHIFAATVDRNAALSAATTVTPAATESTASVSAAWNGNEWLVAWEDLVSYRSPVDPGFGYHFTIKAARLSSSLTVLDPRPIAISDITDDRAPLAASNGDGFLVAWTSAKDTLLVMGQRISSDGSLLANANGAPIARGRAKSVAWDGQQYAVAFSTVTYTLTTALTGALYVTHVAASGPLDGTATQSITSNIADLEAALIATQPGRVIAAYSRVALETPYGDVDRLFLSAPHPIRGRAAGR